MGKILKIAIIAGCAICTGLFVKNRKVQDKL